MLQHRKTSEQINAEYLAGCDTKNLIPGGVERHETGEKKGEDDPVPCLLLCVPAPAKAPGVI